MLAPLFLISLQAVSQQPAIQLARTFTPGEKLSYVVESTLNIQNRSLGVQTWLPIERRYNYRFSTKTEDSKADGVATVHYLRPTIKEEVGETFESGPQSNVLKLNFDYRITMSSLNEVLGVKDLKPEMLSYTRWEPSVPQAQGMLNAYMKQFTDEIYHLALCSGSFDSAIDFAPKLPINRVKPGDTWRKTVGFSPKADGKGDVQRLDYVYTYKGEVAGKSGPVRRVTATVSMNTDLAPLFHRVSRLTAEKTRIAKLPIQLEQTIDFDLDPKTSRTVYAIAKSTGGFSVNSLDQQQALQEQKLRGTTIMTLEGTAH